MAVQQLTLPGEIVKKSNELVRSKISISSVIGSRILASLIACIKKDDTQFKDTYSIEIKNLITDDGGKSYSSIKSICRELAKATAEIEFEDIEEPDSDPIFYSFPFFSMIKYRKGVVSAKFNDSIGPLILDLKECFTRYNLVEYLLLPSIYSQRIFEILKSWNDGRNEKNIIISELHEMLNAPESFKKDFRQFRTRVLEKAHKDITSKTSLHYEWEPVKKGRAVVAVRFIFAKEKALASATRAKAAKEEKARQSRNELGLLALACLKERGQACEGGHQKDTVCEVCKKIR